MSAWQDEVELHRLYQDARIHRNSYFEKLALVDGGTVALVITAVLGPLHAAIRHKYLLAMGLTLLVVAMLTLYGRNLLATQLEFHTVAYTGRDPGYIDNPAATKATGKLNRDIYYTESVGVGLSAIGIVVLLVEVWLIL